MKIGSDIDKAATLLEAGEIVGIPTETVYGLAANALNEHAVAKIFSAKQRPAFDPLIVHLAHVDLIGSYVQSIPQELTSLMNQYMPGPLTVLLTKSALIPDMTTAGLTRVAVRIPKHPLTRELLGRLDFPLAAPSANPFGYISPTTAEHVSDQLGDNVSYILDGGPCHIGLESTIIGLEQGMPTVYRKGGLSIDLIKRVLPHITVKDHSTSNPTAPGMLKSHYAPRIPLRIVEEFDHHTKKLGYITFGERLGISETSIAYDLSPNQSYREAARRLFKIMRILDQQDLVEIQVKLLPEEDLGVAINDRLRRAAAD